MFTDINRELINVKEMLRLKRKYEDHLKRLKGYLKEEEKKLLQLEKQLMKEKEDVRKLERFSFQNIFYTLTGQKLEKLDKEQQEVMAAKLKYNEALSTVEDLKKEIGDYERKLKEVDDADVLYQKLLQTKEEYVRRSNRQWSEKLYELSEQEGEIKGEMKEYEEAIAAGDRAIQKLNFAIEALDSAQNWSTFDMFGGGMISTMAKHNRLNEAEKLIHDAQSSLRMFQDELLDIKDHYSPSLSIDSFLTFADYVFDNFFVDWVVHGKIQDSLNATVDTKVKVNQIVKRLRNEKSILEQKLKEILNKRNEFLESL